MRALTIAAATVIAFSFTISSTAARRGGLPTPRRTIPVTPKSFFQGLYNQANKAIVSKDLDGFLMFHNPDFVEVRDGAEHDLGDKRYRISAWLDLARTAHAYTTVSSASIKGNNASVYAKQELLMVLINPDTRSTADFVYRDSTKDSWVHNDDGWMLQRSEVLSESATNNGKPVYDIDNPFTPTPAPSDDDSLSPDTSQDKPSSGDGSGSGNGSD